MRTKKKQKWRRGKEARIKQQQRIQPGMMYLSLGKDMAYNRVTTTRPTKQQISPLCSSPYAMRIANAQ